jgi:hypothetical protein
MERAAMVSATFHRMIRTPRIRAHCSIDGIGISAVYIARIDNLLKHTVAFHNIAKGMIPYSKMRVKGCKARKARTLVLP